MSDNPFIKKMLEKNETQLLNIINNEHRFQPKAVEAAKEVLQELRAVPKPVKTEQVKVENLSKEAAAKQKIDPRYSLKAIATYQIIGSLLIMPTLLSLYPQVIQDLRNTAILIFFTLLYLTGLVSGVLIYNKKYEGIIAALVFNFIQSFYVQAGVFTFFSTSLFACIYIFPFSFSANITPRFLMSFSKGGDWIIGINLIASTAFVLLLEAESAFHKKKTFPDHLF